MSQPQKNSNQRPLDALVSGAAAVKSGANPADAYAKAIGEGLVPAYFTERELFQLRNACRDSDNENAIRFLNAALARAESKP